MLEAEELAEKQDKLNAFMASEKFMRLSWEHQRLLESQFGAMLSYLTILQVRIELLTPSHNCCENQCNCQG